jgi:hypothetical protein
MKNSTAYTVSLPNIVSLTNDPPQADLAMPQSSKARRRIVEASQLLRDGSRPVELVEDAFLSFLWSKQEISCSYEMETPSLSEMRLCKRVQL